MYKKFLRILFVIVAYVSCVNPLGASSEVGFYYEYGEPDLQAKLRDLPVEEQELRVKYWSCVLIAPLLETAKCALRDELAAHTEALAKSEVKDRWVTSRAHIDSYHIGWYFGVKQPYNPREVEEILKHMVSNYSMEGFRLDEPASFRTRRVMKEGFQCCLYGCTSKQIPALDELMERALSEPVDVIRKALGVT